NYNPQKYKVLEIEEIMEMNKKELTNLMRTRDYDRFGKVDRRKTINNAIVKKENIVMKKGSVNTRSKDTGYRNPKSVLKINKEINGLIHPTQKPAALFEYLIKTYTNEGDTVLDNCMGSGTTAIACINTNRNYLGFELDEGYYKASIERINNHVKDKQIDLFEMLDN